MRRMSCRIALGRFALGAGIVVWAAASGLAAGAIDPRGPIDYPGMKVAVDDRAFRRPDIVSATSAKSRRPGRRSGSGWRDRQDAPVAMFRKEITLAESPTRSGPGSPPT